MRITVLWLVLVVLTAYGCGDQRRALPTTPSTFPPSAPTVSPPVRESPPPLAAGTSIALGHTIVGRITEDDPLCWPGWPYRCQYYRVTVPHDGMLLVTIRWDFPASSPFDMDVFSPSGTIASGQVGVGLERTARGPVTGGTTYIIEVESFLTDVEPFELTTSIAQR